MDDLRDFSAAPIRGAIEARLLRWGDGAEHRDVTEFKRQHIGAMTGTVLEVGPGPGGNLPHYGPDVQLIALEPNPAMHAMLRDAAQAQGVSLDLRQQHGERMDLEDDSVDHAVGTLLLCGVDDPGQVVTQIRRVLRPGGTYVFYEHVGGPPGSWLARAQRLLAAPHRYVFNGCELDRDTGALLRSAGFSSIDVHELDEGLAAGWTRARIYGVAVA